MERRGRIDSTPEAVIDPWVKEQIAGVYDVMNPATETTFFAIPMETEDGLQDYTHVTTETAPIVMQSFVDIYGEQHPSLFDNNRNN